MLAAGAPDITLDGLKAHATVSLDSEQTDMFWACIEGFSTLERSRLLKFATGRIRLPVALKVEANGYDAVPACEHSMLLTVVTASRLVLCR